MFVGKAWKTLDFHVEIPSKVLTATSIIMDSTCGFCVHSGVYGKLERNAGSGSCGGWSRPWRKSCGVGTLRMIRGFPNEFRKHPNGNDTRLISELVDFPCVFVFKVIGERHGDLVGDISVR